MNISSLNQSPNYLSSVPLSADTSKHPQSRLTSALQGNDSAKPGNQRQDALEIFQRTLTMGYEKLQAQQGGFKGDIQQFAGFEPLTAEKVAGNILGFIERRLQMDIADGATKEELNARLEAGLAGFKKGFAEASEKLEALSMLSPEIKQDIGKTYDLVLGGIEQLREKLLGSVAQPVDEPKAASTRQVKENAYAALANSSYQYASASSFSFELTTAEGDKVTINASASRAFAADYQYASAGDNDASVTAESFNASYSASSNMQFTIEGDLSEAELKAINHLVGQVNDLASQFFNGDLDAAFQQALSLGYDQEQITAFSLNLTQVDVQRVSTAYREFEPGAGGVGDLADKLLPLGKFVRDLLASLDTASVFKQPQELLSQLSEKVVAPDDSGATQPQQRFRDFVEQMLGNVSAAE